MHISAVHSTGFDKSMDQHDPNPYEDMEDPKGSSLSSQSILALVTAEFCLFQNFK